VRYTCSNRGKYITWVGSREVTCNESEPGTIRSEVTDRGLEVARISGGVDFGHRWEDIRNEIGLNNLEISRG